MGYLNKESEIVIDAVVTKKGREYLSQAILGEHMIIDSEGISRTITSGNKHKITKFALSDDEIDYALWDITVSGSSTYGTVIENLPMTEAVFNSNEIMNYLLYKRRDGARVLETPLPIPYIRNTVQATTPNSLGEAVWSITLDWDDIDDLDTTLGDVYKIYVNGIFREDTILSNVTQPNGGNWGIVGGTNEDGSNILYTFEVSYYSAAVSKESNRSTPVTITLGLASEPPLPDSPPPGGGGGPPPPPPPGGPGGGEPPPPEPI